MFTKTLCLSRSLLLVGSTLYLASMQGCSKPDHSVAETIAKPVVEPVASVSNMQSVELFSGPMTSIPRANSVGIWLQATPLVDTVIHYWPVDKTSEPQTWQGTTDADGLLKADIDSLLPLTDYAYRVTLAGEKQENIFYFKTLVKNYFPQVHDVSFLFGSCSWWKETDYPIIQTMANHPADFMLWLGDNLYLEPWDYDHMDGIEKKYARTRQHHNLNNLLSSKGQVATWDDHDYGRNDASRDWVFKEEARDVFSKYWINPSYGTPDVPGIQTQFRISDMDFFLLDGRTFRDNPNMPEPKHMYGPEQLRWLKNNILNSRAQLKIIISGSQWLNPRNTFEGWNLYPKEQNAFLSWLKDEGIPGVIFLSGDRHFSEVIQQKREGTYPLYDITCSPLTSILVNELSDNEKDNPFRLEDTLVTQHNYCEMKVTGDKDNRMIDIRSYSATGEVLWHKQIPYTELGL